MNVLVRADATIESGTGHIMRCAAFGTRLAVRGMKVHFACAALPPSLGEWLRLRGLLFHPLIDVVFGDWRADLRQTASLAMMLGGVDLLIVDHYGLDRNWESSMRKYAKRILAVDDLADRDHDCDFLLDQNLRYNACTRYTNRVPPGTRQFIGPQFAMLRDEFDDPALLRPRDGSVTRLLAFFGGTDPGNQSLKLIDALTLLGKSAPMTTLILGPAHPDREMVHARAAGLQNLTILNNTDSMATLLARADLAVGTCGVAAWERCAVGLPSLVVVTAENQREDAEILNAFGAVQNLGHAEQLDAVDFAAALDSLLNDPIKVRNMGNFAAAIMVGREKALTKLQEALFVNS